MTEDRRRDGFYFTGKQFTALLGGILSVQLVVNWWAAKMWVHEEVTAVVREHNVDPEAHARALLLAQQERLEQTKQIIVLQTKIDGIEAMLRTLSSQGAFEHPVGNGRR